MTQSKNNPQLTQKLSQLIGAEKRVSTQVDLIVDAIGSSFATFFFTKTNGQSRKLVGRKGVKFAVKGNGPNYDPEAAGNIILWDMNATPEENSLTSAGKPRTRGGYRTVKKERVFAIKYNGTIYQLNDLPEEFEWPSKGYEPARAAQETPLF